MKYKLKRNYTKTGAMLQAGRKTNGFTQKNISDMLGYSSAQFISNFERGISLPPLKKLKILIKKYKLNADEVVEQIVEERRKELRGDLRC